MIICTNLRVILMFFQSKIIINYFCKRIYLNNFLRFVEVKKIEINNTIIPMEYDLIIEEEEESPKRKKKMNKKAKKQQTLKTLKTLRSMKSSTFKTKASSKLALTYSSRLKYIEKIKWNQSFANSSESSPTLIKKRIKSKKKDSISKNLKKNREKSFVNFQKKLAEEKKEEFQLEIKLLKKKKKILKLDEEYKKILVIFIFYNIRINTSLC